MTTKRYLALLLNDGYSALVDPQDIPALVDLKWRASISHVSATEKYVYATATDGDGRRISMSRFLTGAPAGMEVDHLNGDRLDNRRENLRICTHAENMNNRKDNYAPAFYGALPKIDRETDDVQFVMQVKSHAKDLSEQERRIYCELVRGETINGIAQKLRISSSTASTYRTRILSKLGLKNNAELVRLSIATENAS